MPLLSIGKQFIDDVISGKKKQTIRTGQRYKEGDVLKMWYGPYKAHGRVKIGEAIAISVDRIIFWEDGDAILRGRILNEFEKAALARGDGFKNTKEMIDYFTKEVNKELQLIKWDEIKKVE